MISAHDARTPRRVTQISETNELMTQVHDA
jgi:hypothetical protein